MWGDSKVTLVINPKVEKQLHRRMATTVQPQSETTKEAGLLNETIFGGVP